MIWGTIVWNIWLFITILQLTFKYQLFILWILYNWLKVYNTLVLRCYKLLLLIDCFIQFLILLSCNIQFLLNLLVDLSDLMILFDDIRILIWELVWFLFLFNIQFFCFITIRNFLIGKLSHFLAFLLKHSNKTCLNKLLLIC